MGDILMDKEIRDSIKKGESLANSFVKGNFGEDNLPVNFPLTPGEIVEEYLSYKKIDTDQEFLYLKKRISRKRNILIKSVSAAATIAVLLSIALFTDVFSDKDKIEYSFYESIKPGTRNAILILNDSTVIDLDNQNDSILEDIALIACKDSSSLIFASNEQVGAEDTSFETEFNEIVVPRGGEYSFKLPDGTKVYLNSESSLRFPSRFSNLDRSVYVKGEAVFDVTHDSSRPFIVNAGDVDVKVLGTIFNVRAYENENRTVVTLNEGSVRILRSGQVLGDIEPDQQIVVSGGEFEVKNVNSEAYIIWKEGVFRFDEEPLSTVLAQIGRWYDCRFDIEEELKNKKYSGIINKYDSIEEFVSVLKTTGEFEIIFNKDMHIRINSANNK